MPRTKPSIVTFKADDSLVKALCGVANRSSFIRSAILAALENTCPLCRGSGILNPEQKNHWESFAANHAVKECKQCHEWHLVCAHDLRKPLHSQQPGRATRRKTGT